MNDQWRICFTLEESKAGAKATEVELVDYHSEDHDMTDNYWPPVTPGDVLIDKFLQPLGLSNYRLAQELGVSQSTVGRIVNGKTAITVDLADRLAQRFGTTAKFWLNLQVRYDMECHHSKRIPYLTQTA